MLFCVWGQQITRPHNRILDKDVIKDLEAKGLINIRTAHRPGHKAFADTARMNFITYLQVGLMYRTLALGHRLSRGV